MEKRTTGTQSARRVGAETGPIPAAGLAERTVLFVAHHDAARTGLLWRLSRTTKPIGLGAQLALALVDVEPTVGGAHGSNPTCC